MKRLFHKPYSRRQLLKGLSYGTGLGLLSLGIKPRVFAQTSDLELGSLTWDQIVEGSRGQTVNWAMWSGSEVVNGYADGFIATQLQERYGITLNRVPLTDTVEAVNKVVGEVQAGLTSGGSIDLIWINGENFRTMKQGNLLLGPFRQLLPSKQFYSPENDAVNLDFGLPIEGFSSPYTGSFYIMAMDSTRVDQPPQTFADLLAWAQANPGRFAYVAPPAFDGSRFLLTTLYGVTGGYDQYAGPEFQDDLWTEKSPLVFEYLQELEPYLWRQGQTYPPTQSRLHELFANGEIWMMPVFISRVAEGLASGQFPTTTQAFTLPGVSLNDPSFTAIPINASHPLPAMVLADLLSSPEGQLEKFKPSVWGDPPLLDVSRVPADLQAQFQAVEAQYGIPLQELTTTTVPVVNAEYTTRLEQTWEQTIAR
jgi:putative spermidine/putrescine transport system substrate-binding protein